MSINARPQPFPLIHVEGPPRERGYSYGRQAGDRIEAGLSIYRDAFATAGISWPQALAYGNEFCQRISSYDSGMFAEIGGIAAGAEQPIEAIVILNARTEILFWHNNERTPGGSGAVPSMQEECTSAVALPTTTRDGHLLHGQNWDWNPRCADTAVVLRIDNDDGPDVLTFCEAGQLARHGMNSAGVALTVNGLQCQLDGGHIGVPSPLLRRRLLLAPSLAEALGAVLSARISFSHSLTISQAGGSAITLETTTERNYWLQPEHGLLVHANHFKCPVARATLVDVGLMQCPESLYRDQRVMERLLRHVGSIDVETLKAAFADRFGAPDAVLRTPKVRLGGQMSGTVATLIMDTTAKRLLLAPSPYLGITFTEYGFD